MIIDHIQNAESYAGISERIATALKCLGETDFSGLPDGEVEIRGDEIFALVQRYKTRPREQGKWEAHRNYIDVQFLAEGCELVGAGNIADMQVTEEYSPESDVLFLDGPGDFVRLTKGKFAVLFPHDAHMPCVADGDATTVTKVVVKIKVS